MRSLQPEKFIDRLFVLIEVVLDPQRQRPIALSKLAPEKRHIPRIKPDARQRCARQLDDGADGEALNFSERNRTLLQHTVEVDEGSGNLF